jgi:hypothetical protein
LFILGYSQSDIGGKKLHRLLAVLTVLATRSPQSEWIASQGYGTRASKFSEKKMPGLACSRLVI